MSKKSLLIYAHYYAPDVASTGQILQDLAEGMKDFFDITVICTVPSYSGIIASQYMSRRIYKESINGVNILRVSVPGFQKKKKISRIWNIVSYYFNAKKATRRIKQTDYILTISQPPILGGMLGVYGKQKLKSSTGSKPKLIYCIQDFNPEQIIATNYVRIKPLLSLSLKIDKRTCKSSDLVITVGRDLVETLKNRFRKTNVPPYAMINNWIDEEKIYPLPANDIGVVGFKQKYNLINKFIIMYSGNIGLYYDLENIIRSIGELKGLKTADGKNVVFAFVGDGSMLSQLVDYTTQHHLENVIFIPYQDKDTLIYSLNSADVHMCVNAKGIKGVSCPSKFYGIIAVGKPVLAILESNTEVEMLITEIGCGRVSEPNDYNAFIESVRWFAQNSESNEVIEMGRKGREYLVSNLSKSKSIKKYIYEISNL